MALVTLNNVGISGICACVPPKVIDNATFSKVHTEKEAKKLIRATGIKERRFADEGVCGSDFCVQAGKKLLADMQIDPASIDLLIYLTQTPDYMMIPPTSCILQDRLGLPHSTGAYDMNMNCSGFIYALNAAFSHAMTGMRVLLLVGETLSRTNCDTNKAAGLLFGDAGAALLIEKNEKFGPSFFSLNTDGSLYRAIMLEAGGYRLPASEETLKVRTYEDGSYHNLHTGTMDGMAVYDFTQREVLPDIRRVLDYARAATNDIRYFFFHQANKMIIDMFAMELDIAGAEIPISLDRYGNTSTVSIPLGISADYGHDAVFSFGKTLLSAFGGGLSWGSCILNIDNCYIGKVEDYKK